MPNGMNDMRTIYKLILATCLVAFTSLAQAYVGPGAGLSAIGTILAFLAAIVLMIVGFLWYPIKRLIKGRKERNIQNQALTESATEKTDSERLDQ